MADLKIAIIIGSTRPGRKGKAVADWVLAKSVDRRDADYELVDLLDWPLPLLSEPSPPSLRPSQNELTRNWAAKIAEYDGYVLVTPEYNRSTSGVLKNALDHVYAEWNNKSVGFVSYGSLGGARAVEHLRGIAAELQLADVRHQLSFSLFTDFENFSAFAPGPQFDGLAPQFFAQVEAWAGALKTLRQ